MEFGIAAGVIQVAGTGFQLVEALKDFANSFRHAKEHMEALAAEVALVSNALERLCSELDKSESDDKVYSPQFREDLRKAVSRCDILFKAISKMITAPANNASTASRSRSLPDRVGWVRNRKEVDGLRSDLGVQKNSITLMLEIAAFTARRTSS
jgi:hypothetical protein